MKKILKLMTLPLFIITLASCSKTDSIDDIAVDNKLNKGNTVESITFDYHDNVVINNKEDNEVTINKEDAYQVITDSNLLVDIIRVDSSNTQLSFYESISKIMVDSAGSVSETTHKESLVLHDEQNTLTLRNYHDDENKIEGVFWDYSELAINSTKLFKPLSNFPNGMTLYENNIKFGTYYFEENQTSFDLHDYRNQLREIPTLGYEEFTFNEYPKNVKPNDFYINMKQFNISEAENIVELTDKYIILTSIVNNFDKYSTFKITLYIDYNSWSGRGFDVFYHFDYCNIECEINNDSSNTKEITRYELYTINDSKSLYDKYKKSFINSCKKNNILNKKHEIIES